MKRIKILGIYFLIFILAVIMAFNYQLFIVENGYAPSGITGIATMIQYKTGFNLGYFSLITNIPLCVVACMFTVNKKYCVRTMFYVVCYSVAVIIVHKYGFYGLQYDAHGQNMIFPVLLSGIISGTVNGFLYLMNASTGGTDLISKMVTVKKSEFNFFWINFSFNTAVVIMAFFVYAQKDNNGITVYNYLPVCLSAFHCFLTSFVANYLLKNNKRACKFTIITAYPDEIAEIICRDFKHSCTKMSAVGSYSNDEKTILICVINKNQRSSLKLLLSEYEDTFAFSENVSEIYGNFKKTVKI